MSLAACDVGEVPAGGGGGGGGPDGGGGGSGSLMFATSCVDRSGTPGAPHNHDGVTVNPTHAGEACLNSGCHGPAQPGGEWLAAGTVMKPDQTTPNAGAVVRILSGGKTLQAVVDTGGTWYIAPGAGGLTALAFPAITDVSACPNASPMVTHLTTGNGNCSQQGCHQANGGQGPIRGLQ